MPFAEDQHPVGDFGPGGEHEPFRVSVGARAAGRDLHGLDTSAGQDRAGRLGELPGPVADREPEARGALTQIHHEVADLLHGLGTVRVGGDPEDMHVAAACLDDEQAVQAPESHRAVHVEEIGGEQRRCLHVQELPPGRAGAPCRCRRELQRPEDPADGGCADPVAELEQLALDPLVSPAVVLGGEPPGQRGDLGADRRPSGPVRAGSLPGDQAAVPPQDSARGDQPVRSQPCWQEPGQGGEDRAVGPVQPGPRMGPAQHGDLVPQHEQLRVLGGRRPAGPDQPTAEPDEDEIEQAEGHG